MASGLGRGGVDHLFLLSLSPLTDRKILEVSALLLLSRDVPFCWEGRILRFGLLAHPRGKQFSCSSSFHQFSSSFLPPSAPLFV